MKLTKTLTLVAIVAAGLLGGTSALRAQDASHDKPHAKWSHSMHGHLNMDRIAKHLKLSDEQKAKMQAVLDKEIRKLRELRKDTRLPKTEKQAKARKIRKGTRARLKEILKPEQFKKWEKMMQHHRKEEAKARRKSKE